MILLSALQRGPSLIEEKERDFFEKKREDDGRTTHTPD